MKNYQARLRRIRTDRRAMGPMVATLLLLVIVTVLTVVLYLALLNLTASPSWVTNTVTVPTSATSASPFCVWVNSSAWNDRYCLYITSAPVSSNVTAWTIGGTYDHGGTSVKIPFLLEVSTSPGFSPPAGTVTWGSPGLHGQLVYSGGYSVAISAHT